MDKEKALRFIEALRNHRETTITSEELSSAANVVETFENPNISEESDEDSIRFSIVPGTGRIGTDTALNSVSENGLTAEMSEEDADDLLLDLYQSISEKTRQKVTQKAMKNGFSFPKAMADYIAEMDTDNLSNEDKACLTKARNAIKNALGIVTDGTNTGLSLTDTQWIMYQTAHAGENGIFDQARRVETADRLGHTKADEEEKRDIDNGISVQRADDAVSDSAADMYNKSVSYWLNRLKEGYVDQFESVNALVEAIENELF